MNQKEMKNIPCIDQLNDFNGRMVFMRVDFNVPIERGIVVENFRLKAALQTIRYIAENNGRVILASHLGRPGGKYNRNYTLKPIYLELRKLLPKYQVKFWDKKISSISKKDLSSIEVGEIVMLENLRFYAGENKNLKSFSEKLASMADLYVNEAFSFSHRQAASIAGVTDFLPAYFGFNFYEEVKNLSKLIKPKKPAVGVIGGLKVETKLPLLEKLLPVYDKFLIGGVVANVFLAAQGYEIGSSLLNHGHIREAKEMLKKFEDKLILPKDVLIGSESKNIAIHRKVPKEKDKDIVYKEDQMILDIGGKTVNEFARHISSAKTIVWNGPMGKMEDPKFRRGTSELAKSIAKKSKGPAFGVVGGGETIDALNRIKMIEDMDFVSTGGGAMLDFLTDPKSFIGLAAVLRKK